MNNLDKQYTTLLEDILKNGHRKNDRTGTGTLSVFGREIRFKFKDNNFPLLTTKKIYFRGVVAELLWFLRGETNIQSLVKNNCNIWNGDAYKRYYNHKDMVNPLTMDQFAEEIKTNDEFAAKWGDLGPIYGKQWRKWSTNFVSQRNVGTIEDGKTVNTKFVENSQTYIDQIANLINDLKNNPDSRRLMVTAWNPAELDEAVLPPCHYGFQCYTRELSLDERINIHQKYITEDNLDLLLDFTNPENLDKLGVPTRAISLSWNQRSVDVFLGLPFNIASYGLLLCILGKLVNMVPEELVGNLGDTHLYLNHLDAAKEQIGRELTLDERKQIFEERGFDYMEEFKKTPVRHPMFLYNRHGIPKRTREPFDLPVLDIHPGILDYDIEKYSIELFTIQNYKSHSAIKAELSN
jgi:thymidylate synthase